MFENKIKPLTSYRSRGIKPDRHEQKALLSCRVCKTRDNSAMKATDKTKNGNNCVENERIDKKLDLDKLSANKVKFCRS